MDNVASGHGKQTFICGFFTARHHRRATLHDTVVGRLCDFCLRDVVI